MAMRGEFIVCSASLLSLAAVILLVLVYVGQINNGPVPRGISMVNVRASGYRNALQAAFNHVDPIDGLYATNPLAPLGAANGLRDEYKFGVRSYCGYLDTGEGACGHTTTIFRFRPYSAITSDMSLNYSQFSNAVIPLSNFQNEDSLSSFSRTASYMILLALIFTLLTLVNGLFKYTITFMFAFLFAVSSDLFIVLGAGMWTTILNKAKSINSLDVPIPNRVPVGITVSAGSGLGMTWAAFACMMVATVLYLITCMTFRG